MRASSAAIDRESPTFSGQKGAARFASCGDQPPVGKSCQRELPRHRRHVVPLRLVMLGDPWAVVLVEERLTRGG